MTYQQRRDGKIICTIIIGALIWCGAYFPSPASVVWAMVWGIVYGRLMTLMEKEEHNE